MQNTGLTNDIEIGIDIVAKLYLHTDGNDLPTPFDAKRITNIREIDFGTVIAYKEPKSERVFEYIVDESEEKIRSAMLDAETYRDIAISAINSALEK